LSLNGYRNTYFWDKKAIREAFAFDSDFGHHFILRPGRAR
jgi:hypothetical protein